LRELPTGTVTLLFTDIEGSTRLLDDHGAAYATLLDEHRRVLREAVERHGGVEVDTQGDAFFVAFGRAADALGAVQEARHALQIPVRMGIHTGEPLLTAEGYVGIDVHRAARICAAGHGGQVLVSETTERLLEGVELRDLGEHRLKDLSAPERIYQLGVEDFPPPRTMYRTNLPVQSTPLVGRMREIVEIVERIRTSRLVTLTGPGGVGKTRLALQAAAEASDGFPSGVFFAGLQAVRERDVVLPAVAETIHADRELADWIGDQELLLVLDNLEQVVQCGSDLAELLSQSPRLRLLCTSREPLQIYGEVEYVVEPLPDAEGIELFRQRATDYEPVEAVSAICARLDGLPLAIELAAARTRVLAPAALLKRLDRALPLLVHRPRNAAAGGRTLRATIGWSYDLLDDGERATFDRLGVFAGGCTLEEAEAVADASLEVIESLLEKAMLRRSGERYSMLYVLREFALERLRERGEVDVMMKRFADLVRAGDPESSRDDVDNWRALIDWGLKSADAETALGLASAGRSFRAQPAELLVWAYRALEERGPGASPSAQGRVLEEIAVNHMFGGNLTDSVIAAERAIAIFRQLGDSGGLQTSLAFLGGTLKQLGRNEDAERALLEALEVSSSLGQEGDPFVLQMLGELERDRGNLSEARALIERAVSVSKDRDDWEGDHSSIRHGLGDLALEEGRLELARCWYFDGFSVARSTDAYYLTLHCVAGLAAVTAVEGNHEEAAELWAATERYCELRGAELGLVERERYLARFEAVSSELIDAARERWKDATVAEVEQRAAAALD
jgi:predicted ATPase